MGGLIVAIRPPIVQFLTGNPIIHTRKTFISFKFQYVRTRLVGRRNEGGGLKISKRNDYLVMTH